MNTTEKGNKLEDFVFDYLQNYVQQYSNKNIYSLVVVRKHKSYKKENDDSYVADVSIDCYLKDSDLTEDIDKPCFSVIFECKNYSKKVDKSDFNEFHNKIEHTRNTRVKGFMVTTSGYSQPTINDAIYYGIGLIVVNLDNRRHEIIVSRRLNTIDNTEELNNYLLGEKRANKIVVYDKCSFYSLRKCLESYSIYLKDDFARVKYLKNAEIELQAYHLIEQINAFEIDANKVIDKLISHLGLHIEFKRLEDGQLGMLNLRDKTIVLSISLTGNRRNFTIAHEIGHYILHAEMLNDIVEEYGETELSLSLVNNDVDYIERQANHFASHLLITDKKLRKGFDLFRKQENIRKEYIYVDSQYDNIQRYKRMQDYMRELYGVSWQVVEIRLRKKDLLLIDDNFRTLHISSYI